MKPLMHNSGGVADALAGVYAEPALVPASPWLDDTPPAKPTVTRDGNEIRITPAGEPVRLFVVRTRTGDKWGTLLRAADGEKAVMMKLPAADEVRVSAIDRAGNEGPAATAK